MYWRWLTFLRRLYQTNRIGGPRDGEEQHGLRWTHGDKAA